MKLLWIMDKLLFVYLFIYFENIFYATALNKQP